MPLCFFRIPYLSFGTELAKRKRQSLQSCKFLNRNVLVNFIFYLFLSSKRCPLSVFFDFVIYIIQPFYWARFTQLIATIQCR